MEIEIFAPTQTLPSIEWNYEALKKQLTEKLESYKGIVYSEDSIAVAKKDRANLNKLSDAIDSKRKEMKATYLQPYESFDAQAKELIGLVKAQSSEIDAQIKAFDEGRKANKLDEIKSFFEAQIGDLKPIVPFEKLYDAKWTNVSVSVDKIKSEITSRISDISYWLDQIVKLEYDEEVTNAMRRKYLERLDYTEALHERDRIFESRKKLEQFELRKAAINAALNTPAASPTAAAEPQAEQPAFVPAEAAKSVDTAAEAAENVLTIDFRVYATRTQLTALKEFLITNNIKYGKVK